MRKMLRLALTAGLIVVLAVLAAGCGSKKSSTGTTTTTSNGGSTSNTAYPGTFSNGTPAKGGVYTVGWEGAFGFTDNFDPTGEYLGYAWGLYSNLMLRSLIGYKHQPGAAGNDLVGDLATSVPTPTDGGLTYTYHLRSGVKFGTAGKPRSHVAGRRLRDEPARRCERRRGVLASTTRSSRVGARLRQQAQAARSSCRSRASQHPTPARSSST